MKSTDFKFPLPKNLIAQHPKTPRDECKLMVLDRKQKTIETKKFKDIINYLGMATRDPHASPITVICFLASGCFTCLWSSARLNMAKPACVTICRT